ncbi:hypothetical protein E9840_01280 [Tissierella creatinini]|nr:hypothetical protein E9840_01280 [Tissierella creatinini]TJX64178.1 hypothetical protein E8P77_13070 [Soehngenia saccharolytica]
MQNSFYILPKTRLGKYAVIFTVIAIILVVTINALSINMDIPTDDTGFFGNLLFAVMALGALFCTIISTITGLVAVFKNKERSALVFLCILIGYLAIYFGAAQFVGEITDSH